MTRYLAARGTWPIIGILILLPVLLGAWYHSRIPPVQAGDDAVDGESALAGDGGAVDSLLRIGSRMSPFRFSRTASQVPYDPRRTDPTLQHLEPSPPRPSLAISGIVEGERRAAVVEGIPGRDRALLMQVGDTAGGIRIRRITFENVVITGFDTTWTLSVRRPW